MTRDNVTRIFLYGNGSYAFVGSQFPNKLFTWNIYGYEAEKFLVRIRVEQAITVHLIKYSDTPGRNTV